MLPFQRPSNRLGRKSGFPKGMSNSASKLLFHNETYNPTLHVNTSYSHTIRRKILRRDVTSLMRHKRDDDDMMMRESDSNNNLVV